MVSTVSPEGYAKGLAYYGDDKALSVIAGSIILMVVVTFVVILRLVASRTRKLGIAVDDGALIVVVLMFAYGMSISLLVCKSSFSMSVKSLTMPSNDSSWLDG